MAIEKSSQDFRTGDSMEANVAWTDDQSTQVQSADEMRQLLGRLQSEARAAGERPFMAEVTLDAIGSLALGIGLDVSILVYTGWEGAPPYLISRGRPGATNNIVFYYMGEWSEYPGTAEVAFDVALDAICEFVDTGAVPTWIDWDG
jgi:hypothetical protein